MKKLFLYLYFLLFSVNSLMAQDIKGRVVDASGQPIEYLTVSLLSLPDSSFISGTTTKDDGTFLLKQAKDKSCIIKISGLGYSPVYMQSTDSLANITLQDITYNVGEVSVVGKRPTSKTVDGNITFFVENTNLSKYASGIMALGQLPFIETAADGISVKGKGAPLVYINNKKVMDDNELNRLAADRIKSVELILVPGPEYPQGTNAVVKIKTIRHEQGLSVEVASNENWFNRFSHEQDLDLNYRIGKWDIFAAAEYGKYKTKEKNENLYFTKNINPAYTLTDYSDRNYIYANTGINYSDDKKHSAGISYSFTRYPNSKEHKVGSVFIDGDDGQSLTNSTEVNSFRQSSMHHVNTYYDGKLSEKSSINANFDYLGGSTYRSSLTSETGKEPISSNSTSDYSMYTGKIQSINSILGGTLTVGTEITYSENNEDYTMNTLDMTQYYPSSSVRSTQWLAGVFLSHRLSIKDFAMSFGGRLEYTDYQYYNQGVKVSDVCERHTRLFPFLRLSYNKDISVSLSYTNGITRPPYSSMTNMLTYIDSYTAYQGNPNLKAAYRNVIDAVVSWKDLYFNASYTWYKDEFSSMSYVNDHGVIVSTVDNMDNYSRLSADLSYSPTFGIWSPSLSAGVAVQNLTYNNQKLNKPFYTYSVDNSFTLFKRFELYITCYGQTKGDSGNSSFHPNFVTDMNLSTQLLKNKLSVTLSFTDVFNTEKSWYTTISPTVKTDFKNYRDRHGISIHLRYKFNQVNSKYKGGMSSSEIRRLIR